MELLIRWDLDCIRKRKPDWSDEQCLRFFEHVEENLVMASRIAGENVIDEALGLKKT